MHRMRWQRCLMAAGCALALAACGRGGSDGKAQGPVVLKVNDKTYTTAEVERELMQELRGAPQLQPYLASKEGQKQFLDRLVRRELLLQEAERQKMGDRPEVAERVAALRRDLMLRALLQEEVGAKVKVEDKDVQEYFAAHPEEFSGDLVRVRHILVRTEDEAKQVQERLAKNERFEDLARTLSRDTTSAAKGGDLDYLKREQLFPDFAKAAFDLRPGEVSGIVRTPFGYHILKLVGRKKGQPSTYEQVKDQLRRRLIEERQNQRYQEWMKGLEAAAKITRDESLLPLGQQGSPSPDAGGAGAGDGKGGGGKM